MPSYKLIYFNSKGRAELSRFILAQAGVEYEDVRLTKEQWAELKPSTPFGGLPVLEVDGKKLAGSSCIARFLAEEHGLGGSNALENAQISAIVDAGGDIVNELMKFFFESDESKKPAAKERVLVEVLPKKLPNLEKLVSEDGWLFNNKVSWADLCIYIILDWIMFVKPDVTDDYPGLGRLQKAVEALPNIAKWMKERPVTEH